VNPNVAVAFTSPKYMDYVYKAIERCYEIHAYTKFVSVTATGSFKCYYWPHQEEWEDPPHFGPYPAAYMADVECAPNGNVSAKAWKDMTHQAAYYTNTVVCKSTDIIGAVEQCQVAGSVTRYSFSGTVDDPAKPKGCFWNLNSTGNGSYFNLNTYGSSPNSVQGQLGSICKDPNYYNHSLSSTRKVARTQLKTFLDAVENILKQMLENLCTRSSDSQIDVNESWGNFTNCSCNCSDGVVNMTELNITHRECREEQKNGSIWIETCQNDSEVCITECKNETIWTCPEHCSAPMECLATLTPRGDNDETVKAMYPNSWPSAKPYMEDLVAEFQHRYETCYACQENLTNCTDNCTNRTIECCYETWDWCEHKRNCTEIQWELEQARCQHNCSDEYEECWDHGHAGWIESAKSRNETYHEVIAEWRAIKRIQCILDAFWDSIEEKIDLDTGLDTCIAKRWTTPCPSDPATASASDPDMCICPIEFPICNGLGCNGTVPNRSNCSDMKGNITTFTDYLPGTVEWIAEFYTGIPYDNCSAICSNLCVYPGVLPPCLPDGDDGILQYCNASNSSDGDGLGGDESDWSENDDEEDVDGDGGNIISNQIYDTDISPVHPKFKSLGGALGDTAVSDRLSAAAKPHVTRSPRR